MPTIRRKVAQEAVRARVIKVLNKEPDLDTRAIIERFGISATTIKNIRKRLKERSFESM